MLQSRTNTTMLDLTDFGLKEMTACGAALRRLGDGATTMEDVAARTVNYLYENLIDSAGARACVMARFFITHPYCDLEPDYQAHSRKLLGGPPADPGLRCQALPATRGDRPEWNDRHRSAYYKVLPLTARIVEENLMHAQFSETYGVALDKPADSPYNLRQRRGVGIYYMIL